jgi:hypothetical protein
MSRVGPSHTRLVQPRGEGSVYQRRSDGRWCVALPLPDGCRVVRYAPSERDAKSCSLTCDASTSSGPSPLLPVLHSLNGRNAGMN